MDLLVVGATLGQPAPPPPFPTPKPPIWLPFPAPPPVPVPGRTISLKAVVTDDAGRAIAGARISLARFLPAPRLPGGRLPIPKLQQVTAVTDAKGEAMLTNLAQRTYTGCIEVAGSLFLNPCKWAAALRVDAAATADGAWLPLRLRTGSALKLLVRDPNGLAARLNLADPMFRPFKIGVRTTGGAFHLATLVQSSGADLSFELAVPTAQDLRVVFYSKRYYLVTAEGGTLDSTSRGQPFRVPAGTASFNLAFTLAGRQ